MLYKNMKKILTFQETLIELQRYWSSKGCIITQSAGVELGAATLNKNTFLKVLGDDPWNVAYIEPCKRPADGRYSENPNRLQQYYQFQVLLKPAPADVQKLLLESYQVIGLNPMENDIRFIEDDWEHPAIAASGLGWEVWALGMEITQFTYFQQCGGMTLNNIACELTYGLERISMCIQEVSNVYDLIWAILPSGKKITYGDIHKQDEQQWSCHNYLFSNIEMLQKHYENYNFQAKFLLEKSLFLPAYDYLLKCSHIFNLLDARNAIKPDQKLKYIHQMRDLAKQCAEQYLQSKNNNKLLK